MNNLHRVELNNKRSSPLFVINQNRIIIIIIINVMRLSTIQIIIIIIISNVQYVSNNSRRNKGPLFDEKRKCVCGTRARPDLNPLKLPRAVANNSIE